MDRKLAAILSADVQGYSRLMSDDEEGTIQTLTLYRRLMASLVEQHRGRVVDSPGDNVLAEFGSVVDAVQGAVSIQVELNARNLELEPERRMEFRIGINLGDVVADGDQIYGDGVNIAARVESLADAGGICISGTVHEHIKNKLPLGYVSLGEQSVKNITDPIRVYRLQGRSEVEGAQSGNSTDPAASSSSLGSGWAGPSGSGRMGILAAALLLGLLGAGLLLIRQDSAPALPAAESVVATAEPTSPKPSAAEQRAAVQADPGPRAADPVAQRTPQVAAGIGVMNFKPLSPADDAAWMTEAIRDNLNGQLSKVPGLEVYSKEYIDFLVEDGTSELKVAHELGISRMVSGSYLAKADRLRIEAHVVNVQTGLLEVSDFVEGSQEEFFQLQSQLAFKIAGHLDLAMSVEDRAALAAVPASPGLDAYKMLLEAEDETSEAGPPEERPERPESRSQDEVWRRAQELLRWAWLGPRAAWAEEVPEPAEDEIREVLERYRQAYELKNLDMLGSVYVELTPKQRNARARYFENAQDLEVEINKVRIAVRGDDAVVSYTRADQFTDQKTGETVKLDVRLTKMLQRVDGAWKMTGGKK